jgi:hypothetical protein
MAKFENEKLGVSFSLPEKPTVRQQLAYFSEAGLARGQEFFERLWLGACSIIQDWQCPTFPDANIDISTISDPNVTEVILWASMEVRGYMNALDNIPKNS